MTSSGYDVVESTCCPLLTYVSLPCLGPASVPLADSRLLVVIATCRVWSLDLRHTVAAVLLVAMATAASVNVSVQSTCTHSPGSVFPDSITLSPNNSVLSCFDKLFHTLNTHSLITEMLKLMSDSRDGLGN